MSYFPPTASNQAGTAWSSRVFGNGCIGRDVEESRGSRLPRPICGSGRRDNIVCNTGELAMALARALCSLARSTVTCSEGCIYFLPGELERERRECDELRPPHDELLHIVDLCEERPERLGLGG